MNRLFDDNFLEMLDDLCNVVSKKHAPTQSTKITRHPHYDVLHFGTVVYYIDHGKVRTRSVEAVQYVGDVHYRGTLPKYENIYYGSMQRNGFLYKVKFDNGDPVDILIPEHDETICYGHYAKYWLNKDELVKNLTKRLDRCGEVLSHYQKKVDFYKNRGEGIVRCLNTLDNEWF